MTSYTSYTTNFRSTATNNLIFMLGALFQSKLGHWWWVRALPALYCSYAHAAVCSLQLEYKFQHKWNCADINKCTCWMSSLHADNWFSASSSFLLFSACDDSSCAQCCITVLAWDFILLMYRLVIVKSSSIFSAPTWMLPGCCWSLGTSSCVTDAYQLNYTTVCSEICLFEFYTTGHATGHHWKLKKRFNTVTFLHWKEN